MAVQLQEGQKLERIIKVYGVEQPVIVKVTNEGISFRVKGTSKEVTQNWVQTVQATNTPTNVKSYHMNKPYEFLKDTAVKVTKNRQKKADKTA